MIRCNRAGHLFHPIQPDIPRLDEIADDSDNEDYVEELVLTEECTEAKRDNFRLTRELSPFALISLFSTSIKSFLTIHTKLVRIEKLGVPEFCHKQSTR
jgi:hypothetical protein